MAENKMRPTSQPVEQYVAELEQERRRDESATLIDIMQRVSGHEPVMWGESIIGFGAYHYTYATGREGDAPLLGFSPRKAKLSIYLTDGHGGREELLEQLGPHTHGKSCLYITRLDRVDLAVLERMCEESIARTRTLFPEVPVPPAPAR